MKEINKIIFLSFLFITIVSCNSAKPQDKYCEVNTYEGLYLYEYSNNLTVIDDMVLRDALLIKSTEKSDDLYDKVFFANPQINIMPKSALKGCSKELKNSIDNVLEKETFSDYFYETKSKEVVFNNNQTFKEFYLKFEAIFLGDMILSFNIDEKVEEKKVPAYLILDVKSIKAIN